MAKVTAPLLSLDAKGTLAKKMTFQNRKGTNTVYWNKGHSDNPSEASEIQRTWFREATQAWNELTDEQKQTYKDRAKAIINEKITGYNLYIREYPTSTPEPTYEWQLQDIPGSGSVNRSCISINSDGNKGIITSFNNRIYLLNNNIWEETRPAGDINTTCYTCAINEDGTKAIIGIFAGKVYTLNNGTWTEHNIGTQYGKMWMGSAITSDGAYAYICAEYGRIHKYDWNEWTEIQPIGDMDWGWIDIHVEDTGQKILVKDDYTNVYIYEGEGWEKVTVDEGTIEYFLGVHMSKNGENLIMITGDKYSHIRKNGVWQKVYIADTAYLANSKTRINNNGDKNIVPYPGEQLWWYKNNEYTDNTPEEETVAGIDIIDMSIDGEIMALVTMDKKIYIRKQI